MKKKLWLIGLISIISLVSLVGCGVKKEVRQTEIIDSLNQKYSMSVSENDVVALDEEGKSAICYFGTKKDIFDDTDLYAAVYDASSKTYIDNYSACLVQSELVDKVTKITDRECYVYVNTMMYPLTEGKYESLDEYLDSSSDSVVLFNIYIHNDPANELNVDTLKEAYKKEFGHKGNVQICILDDIGYKTISDKDYESFIGVPESSKIYNGVIEW